MSCETYKPLLMGYLDGELTEVEALRVRQHIGQCEDCAGEAREFGKLKEVTSQMRLILPEDENWDQYWSRVYNRLERRVGWILVSIGCIVLSSQLLYGLIDRMLFDSGVSMVVRIGVTALVIGLCTLLISVFRERMFASKVDKYRRIKR